MQCIELVYSLLPRPKPKSPARTLASRSVAGTPLDRSPGKGPRSYAVIRHLRSPYSDLPDIGGHSTVQGIPFRHSGKAPPLAGSASPPDRPEAPPEWVYTGVCTFPLLYHVLDLRTCHSTSSSLGTFSRSCPGLLGVVEQGDLGGIRGGGRERAGSARRLAHDSKSSTAGASPPNSQRCISLGVLT